ncbi:IPT/TIG domain-containing protein, partial [Patescibacteria group bacterium]
MPPRRKWLSKRFLIATAFSCLLAFIIVTPALAQGGPDLGLEFATETGLTTTDVRTTISRIIRSFLGFLGIVAVMIILYAGFLWMTAGGNEEQVSKAKKMLINGVIGLVIILSAFTIVTFLFRAITGEGTTGSSGGDPGGSNLCTGFDCDGGSSFYVESITVYGPGPSSGGWPKNYALTATLSRPPNPETIDASSVKVEQCNPRIDSDGSPLAFDFSACGAAVPLTSPPLVEGRKIIVKPQWPDPSPEDDPTDFEGEYWYMIELVGGFISDSDNIETLYCPPPSSVLAPEEDISSTSAPKDLCVRAVAMNDMRDVEAPEVRLNTPKSPPGFCSSTISIEARATDDFLPSRIEFQLQDEETGIFYDVFEDEAGVPHDGVSTNSEQVNPYHSREILINAETLPPGRAYTLTAVAFDPVPRSSENVAREVIISPAHCCNGLVDPAETGNLSVVPEETGIDCGDGPLPTMCGLCAGDTCVDDTDCTSGYCDPVTHTCVEQPIIDDISVAGDQLRGGPGTPVVISGRFFSNRGGVVFLGTDDDGSDDVQAPLCAPDAWRYFPTEKKYEVTVLVPEGAVSGPIQLVTSDGQSDDTTDEGEFMTAPDEFDVDAPVLPGVCYLSPNTGPSGTETTIHGAGFGEFSETATLPVVEFGENPMTLVDVENNWENDSMVARAPAVRDGVYPVRVTIGGITTAPVSFSLVPPAGYESPTITEILPSSGPIDSYVTIVGSGFGSRKGTVKFFIGDEAAPDIALAGEPVCDQNWFKNYIIVKVPQNYQAGEVGTGIGDGVRDGIHRVQVETASPSDTSNTINFTVNDDVLKPGMCSITPDNGPPALPVYVSGEGFGADQATDGSDTVDFYMDGELTMPSENYGDWRDGKVTAYVPGLPADRATWPRTGPVYVKNANLFSSNGIPYLVQNCNDPGATCEIGTFCCENGVCDAGTWVGDTQTRAACEPLSRDSSYGWKFSTDTLPSVPQVVERSSCAGGAFKSPSPYKQSEDACINAKLQVQFNRLMDVDSLNAPGSVKVEMCKAGTCSGDGVTSCYENSDCGQGNGICEGAEPRCRTCDEDGLCEDTGTAVPTYIETTDGSLDPQDSSFGMYMFINRIGDVVWEKNKWYKVTFVSRVPSEDGLIPGFGVQERETLRYLDGDFDKSLGGDYEYFFKTRDSDLACELSKVTVIPPDFTIDHLMGDSSAPGSPDDGFRALLGAANCNTLNCFAGPVPQYDITWDTDTDFLEPVSSPTAGACVELFEVRALQEAESVIVEASGVGVASSAVPKVGESDVRIKFADPYVKEYAPNCTEACVNGGIWAKFNVMMQADTLNSSTIDVIKCRNASCNPPFITTEQPTGLNFSSHGDTSTLFDGSPASEGFLISLPPLQTFDPAS